MSLRLISTVKRPLSSLAAPSGSSEPQKTSCPSRMMATEVTVNVARTPSSHSYWLFPVERDVLQEFARAKLNAVAFGSPTGNVHDTLEHVLIGIFCVLLILFSPRFLCVLRFGVDSKKPARTKASWLGHSSAQIQLRRVTQSCQNAVVANIGQCCWSIF